MAWSQPNWNEPLGKSLPKPVKRTPKYLIAIGVVLSMVVVVGVAFFVSSSTQSREIVPKTAEHKKVVTKKPPKDKRAPRQIKKETVAPTNALAVIRQEKKKEYVKKPGQLMTDDGRILTFPPPAEGEFRIVHSHGKVYKCDHLGNFEDVTPKPVFDNTFEENLIGMTTEHGSFIPGMLLGLDQKDVMAMLNKKIDINPDDSEDVVKKKEDVARLKEGILEYIKQGGTFDEFVMEMRKVTAQERKTKSTAMRDIVQLLKDNRVEEAAFYRKALNAQLEKNGSTPLKFPAHITEILDQVKDVPEPTTAEAAKQEGNQ